MMRKIGTNDTHANSEIPGYGKEKFNKRAEKMARKIHKFLLINL